MASYTFYPATGDGALRSSSAVWATAQSGGGTLDVFDSLSTISIGKFFGASYFIYQAGLSFDTSSIPNDAELTAATLSVVPSSTESLSWTMQARVYDFGSAIAAADWRTSTQWNALTLAADYVLTSGWTDGSRVNFNESGSNLRDAISLTGSTRLWLCSDNWTGIAPAGDDAATINASEASGTTNDPKLEVTTYEPPSFTPFVMWIA